MDAVPQPQDWQGCAISNTTAGCFSTTANGEGDKWEIITEEVSAHDLDARLIISACGSFGHDHIAICQNRCSAECYQVASHRNEVIFSRPIALKFESKHVLVAFVGWPFSCRNITRQSTLPKITLSNVACSGLVGEIFDQALHTRETLGGLSQTSIWHLWILGCTTAIACA